MNLAKRKFYDMLFKKLCLLASLSAIVVLTILLTHVFFDGVSWLSWDFLKNFPSRFPSKAGIWSALVGSFYLISLTGLFAIPTGVATAIYLEEYIQKDSKASWWIRVNIGNLAGMPSIVYGLLGLAIFVRLFAFDRSLLAGSLTLALLILPVIVIVSQEAIRAVPHTLREAAFALGATRWEVVFGQVLPAAVPGIMTGAILSLSRAMGESAPLIMIGALSYVAFTPTSIGDPFTALPIQIFNWAARPQADFHHVAAAGIIVLLIMLLMMNFVAVYIRQHFQKYRI